MSKLKISKRQLLKLIGLGSLAFSARPLLAQESLTRIAFGSCLHQDKPQPIWDAVIAANPQLFLFLGDNIYGDSDDPAVLAAQYQKLSAQPGFQRLQEMTELQAIWDDHDYGRNDAGVEYPSKEASRELFLDFWKEPASSARRSRPDGIYTASTYGPQGRRTQIIMLDLRWNRTALTAVPSEAEQAARVAQNMGPYAADFSAAASLLGAAQWRWLEEQLREPAELRILCSSIQVLADFTGWESWANFPAERERLLQLLGKTTSSVNLIISGDVHWCEYSQLSLSPDTIPLAELTSSGLTETWEAISPNRHRVGEAYAVANFGLIEIDWRGDKPRLHLSVRDQSSAALIEQHHPHF